MPTALISTHTNGHARGNPFIGPPLTARYRPGVHDWGGAWWITGQRPFFRALDVPIMWRDPRIRFGVNMLIGVLSVVRWQGQTADSTGQTVDIVQAHTPEAKAWVEGTLERFWKNDMARLERSNLKYGWACGEVRWQERNGQVFYDDVLDVEPLDAVPLETDDGFWGARVHRIPDSPGVDLTFPRVLWLANDPEGRRYKGRSNLEGAWEPWVEKRGKHGGCDSRRGWYTKNAFSGGTMRYPPGYVEAEDGSIRSNQDYAREVAEKKENGGILLLPQGKDDNGNDLWSYEEPKVNGSLEGVREYIKDLDGEMLEGMDVPGEVVTAAETGSGWSGRSIPMVFFLVGGDVRVLGLLRDFNTCVTDPGFHHNFPGGWYKVTPPSLLQLTKDNAEPQYPQGGDSGQGGSGPLGNAEQGFGRGGHTEGASGAYRNANLVPYSGARGGHGWRNPTTGRVEYEKRLSLEAVAAGWPVVAEEIRERVRQAVARRLPKPKKEKAPAIGDAPQNFVARLPVKEEKEELRYDGKVRRAALFGVRLAQGEWVRYRGPKGGQGWRSTRTGRILYQTEMPGEHEHDGPSHPEPAGGGSPQGGTGDLRQQLGSLKTAELKELAKKHQTFGRTKEELVENIAKEMEYKAGNERPSAPAATPAIAPGPTQSPPEDSGGQTADHAVLMRSWHEIDARSGGHNFVNLADWKRSLPQMSKEQFHGLINSLHKEGLLSMSPAEGRHGITREEQDVALADPANPGAALLYASVRPEARDRVRQLLGG